MDETIGVKGGYNDRKRTLKISKEQKKKLVEKQREKELKELEERVKKKQFYTLIKTLPIAIGGGTFKVLYDNATGKNNIDKEEENSKWKIKEYSSDMSTKSRQEVEYEKQIKKQQEKLKEKEIVIIQDDGTKIIVKVPIEEYKKIIDYSIQDEQEKKENKIEEPKVEKTEKEEVVKKEEIEEENKEDKTKEEIVEELNEENIDNIDNTSIEKEEEISFDDLSPSLKEKLNNLKSRKIIDVYGRQLKDIRYDLKQLIFDYNVLVDESEDAITSKELESILDRLNDVIDKVEVLKNKIQIDNLDKYDDNYIYTLIEDYLLEFKDKKVVSEIKDSPLYILISEKLEELDKKKENFKKDVEKEKEQLAIKEENFDKLKEKYYSVEKLNKYLIDFQEEQEFLLREVREKINNAVSVTERVEVQMKAMNRNSLKLLRQLTKMMFFPGPKAARGTALTTAAYLNFVKQILNPETTTKKYKVVKVSDYSFEIENSIKSIDNALNMLSKSSKEVSKLIKQVKEDFKDYLGVFRECDELLSNLEKVQRDLKEKEDEMQRIKKQQEKELERNNAKVLTRGEYPM